MKKIYAILTVLFMVVNTNQQVYGFNPNPFVNTNTPQYQQYGNPYPQFQSLETTQNLAQSLDRFNSIANSSEFQNVSIQSLMPENETNNNESVDHVPMQESTANQPVLPVTHTDQQSITSQTVHVDQQPAAHQEVTAENHLDLPVTTIEQKHEAVLPAQEHALQPVPTVELPALHQQAITPSPEINLIGAAQTSSHLQEAVQAEHAQEHHVEAAVHTSVQEHKEITIEPLTKPTEQIKIVKVYPVYDAVRSALHGVYNAGQDMINYVYSFMNKETKKDEVKTQCQEVQIQCHQM